MNRRQATALLLGAAPAFSAAMRAPLAAAPAAPAAFPLTVSPDKRCLLDAAGRPFLVTGDAAWSLVVALSRADVDFYLARRRAKGFNALLVNLIEHQFSPRPPANAYGEQPFLAPGRFDRPNPLYFDHAVWVAERALANGFLVLLCPAYLGAMGGGQGWYTAMLAAGPEALRSYGRYVGARFRACPNVVYANGGDYDDPDRSLVAAVVAGIRDSAPSALHTVHGRVDTVPADYWRGSGWLALDTVYTYGDVHAVMRERYARRAGLPILMIEALYEGEHGTDARMVRRQAWGAMLGGGAGQVYGNSPVWHFTGPGIDGRPPPDWKPALDAPGAAGIGHLRHALERLDWWKIAPGDGTVLPHRDGAGYAICGVATDNSFALAYAEGGGPLTLVPPWAGARPTRLAVIDPATGRTEAEETFPPAPALSLPASANADRLFLAVPPD